MKVFNFLTKKKFYIHLIIIIALIVLIIEAVFISLASFTRHDDEITIPDFVGMNYQDMLEQYKNEYNFILLDSVYVKGFLEGAVYQQDPLPGSKVKKGRNLYYIMVSKEPEKVMMPNLRNLSLRQALVLLEAGGLTVSNLEYVNYFAKNAVIEQLYDTAVIEPGTPIIKGSAVKLRVGYGKEDKKTHLPNLLSAKKSDVKRLLHEASLNLGNEIFMDNDENDNYKVYKMEPQYDIETLVTLGSKVDVWYHSESQFDFNAFERELFLKDSIVSSLKRKKMPEDSIKYIVDSFNYILSHRKFLFDSKSRECDKNIRYEKEIYESFDFDDSLYDNIDYEIDTDYYYDYEE